MKSTTKSAYPEDKTHTKRSVYEKWEAEGQPLHYVRFQTAVPPHADSEPVYEFRLEARDKKYVVERITDCGERGIIFRSNGELDKAASANVVYTRSIQS